MASTRNRFARSKKLSSVASAITPVTAIPESAPALSVIDDQGVAANHHNFDSEGFNAFGMIASPEVACAYFSRQGKTEATLWAHLVGTTWFSGFDFAFKGGDYACVTSLPSIHGGQTETKSKAVEGAANALLNELDARFPDHGKLVKTQSTEIKRLRQWLNAQAEKGRGDGFEPKPSFTFIDLCAGIGGFHLGLAQAGGHCVLACEIDQEARQTYSNNHLMNGIPFASDITRLDAKDIPDHDVLAAGFPCQAFSISGQKEGFKEVRGQIIFHLFRIIEAKRPKVVLLENVKNFCSGEDGQWSRTLRHKLAGLGYAVCGKVLNAADFGTAQERERVFYVAYRVDIFSEIGQFQMPVGDGRWVSVADILEPNAPASRYKASDIMPFPTQDKKSPLQRVGKLYGRRGQDARVYDPTGHATTLMANQQNCGLYLVNGLPRQLTPRERARLQGFPETFKPHPVKTQANKQFGNSVAVPIVAAFGNAFNHQFFSKSA